MEKQIPMELAESSPASAFRALAELVYAADDYAEMYDALCHAAVQLVDGCHHASLMVERDGRLVTAAASDDVGRLVDRIEREVGEGPCLDVIHEETPQLDGDLTTESTTWPLLRGRILDETPVRAMAGFRLVVDQRKVGSLNVLSDAPGCLTPASVDQGAVLASFASVALISATHHEQATTLRDGLASNREIGKAVGLMMAFHKVGDEEAFAILRKASQEMNLKLTEVARQVVEHHNQRPPA